MRRKQNRLKKFTMSKTNSIVSGSIHQDGRRFSDVLIKRKTMCFYESFSSVYICKRASCFAMDGRHSPFRYKPFPMQRQVRLSTMTADLTKMDGPPNEATNQFKMNRPAKKLEAKKQNESLNKATKQNQSTKPSEV